MLLLLRTLYRPQGPATPPKADRFDYQQIAAVPAGVAGAQPPGMARMAAHIAMLRRARLNR